MHGVIFVCNQYHAEIETIITSLRIKHWSVDHNWQKLRWTGPCWNSAGLTVWWNFSANKTHTLWFHCLWMPFSYLGSFSWSSHNINNSLLNWKSQINLSQTASRNCSVEAAIVVTTAHNYSTGRGNRWRAVLLITGRDYRPLVLAPLTRCWISAASSE